MADASTSDPSATDPSADLTAGTPVVPAGFRMMPIRSSSTAAAEPARSPTAAAVGPHLSNFGGPILINGIIWPVFWNQNVPFSAAFSQYYPTIVNSPLWSMLSQYGIKVGTAHAPVLDNRTTGTITDAAIQTELKRAISTGLVPAQTPNTYYPIHFPPGMHITAPDGSRSCVQFCAYHGTFVFNGTNVYYGVIPYVGDPGCAGGCGGNTVQNNEQSVASHELIEAVTDPAVGLATVIGPPLGWYDPNNGEIGDICNGQQGTTLGLVVQKEWSNAANACVDH